MQKLKYDDQFKGPHKMRAYDFLNIPDRYVEGIIVGTDTYRNAMFYVIHCEKDTLTNFQRLGGKVYVQIEVIFESEWEFDRIQRVWTAKKARKSRKKWSIRYYYEISQHHPWKKVKVSKKQ